MVVKDIIVGGFNKWDYLFGMDIIYYDIWVVLMIFNVGDNLGKWIFFILCF